MFSKFYAFSPLALALLLCGCEEEKTPLPNQPAIFSSVKTDAPEHFNAELKNAAFTAGGKSLKMDKAGNVMFNADGRASGKFFMPLGVRSKDVEQKEYLAVDQDFPKENFRDSEQCFKEGKFRYGKTIVKKGKQAECSGEMELLPDGRIKLSYKWGDFGTPEFRLEPYSLMFDIPFGDAKNAAYVVDGKIFRIPETTPDAGKTFQTFPSFKELEVFADSPARSIKIQADSNCGYLSVSYNPFACGYATFRATPKAGSRSMSIVVDIGNGVARRNEAQSYGGIDFKAVEALELPDYNASPNFISNPSFERGTECYGHDEAYSRHVDLAKLKWSIEPFQLDSSTAMFGSHSLKLLCSPKNADFRQMGYHLRSFPVPLGKGKYCVSVYAKGEPGATRRLSVWIPSAQWFGNIFLPVNNTYPKPGSDGAVKVFSLSPEWKRYSFSFDLPDSMPTQISIGADSSDGQGHVWIDGLQLERGTEPTVFHPPVAEGWLRTANSGNFLDVDARLDARLEITAAPHAAGTVSISAKDFYNAEVFRHSQSFTCDALGKAIVEIPVKGGLPQGIFVVKAEYTLAGGAKTFDLHRIAIMKLLDGECRLKGIFNENYGGPDSRADFLKLLKRYRETGIGSRTQIYNWDEAVWDAYRENKIEPLDAYTFTFLAHRDSDSKSVSWVVADPVGIIHLRDGDPRILLGVPRFDADGRISKEYLAQLKDTVEKIVKEHPWAPAWDAGNETPPWVPSWAENGDLAQGIENLAKFQKSFIEGVKAGNPNAKTVSDYPCNMSPENGVKSLGEQLSALKRLGGPKFDMAGCHIYRASPESPDLDADTKAYLEMLDSNGYGDAPVYWGEGMHYGPYNIPQWGILSATWGLNTWYYGALSYDMGWTEKISAAWRARSWLVALKYQDRIKSAMAAAQTNNFDMDVELTPFATQKMPNTLSELLGDARFKKDVRFAPYIRCYIFEDAQKRPVAAIWCHHPKLDAGRMEAPRAAAKLGDNVESVFDLMCRERAYAPNANGVFEFPITSFPAFIRGKAGTLDAFANAFEDASLISGADISPMSLLAKPISPNEVEIKARNFLSKPFDGTLILPGVDETPLSAPASGTGSAKLKLPTPLTYGNTTEENLQVAVKSGKSDFGGDLAFEGLLCKKVAKDFPMDCDLSAWKDIPAAPLRNRILRNCATAAGAKEFNAWFKIAWTEKGLNLLVKVRDDKFVHLEQADAAARWNNDSLQVYFDSLCEARGRQTKGYGDSEYEYSVFPSPDGKSAASFRSRQADPQLSGLGTSAPPSNAWAPELPAAFKLEDDGYIYQLFIPAKYLLPGKMEKGYAFGFALLVNDRDGNSPGKFEQRESGLTNTPPGTEPYNNPKQWPALLLWE